MTWLAIRAALGRVPWFVWAGLAVVALWGFDRTRQYREGYSDGEQAVEQRLRTAEAEALKKASEAHQNADKAGEKRALAEAEAHNVALEAIRKAEANDQNPLDSLF